MKISGAVTATIAASGATCKARCSGSGIFVSRLAKRKKLRAIAVTAAMPRMVAAA
jgi:hypothetical protein